MTIAEVIANAEDKVQGGSRRLSDALREVAGDIGTINARKLGRWISKNRRVIVDGLFFDEAGKSNNVSRWRVRHQDGV